MTLADRLRAALALPRTPDADPHPALLPDPMPEHPQPAAVLIAITDRAEPGVILTQRTDTLRRHAGQVAFPGGRLDPGDADAVAAALREAEEEIALPARQAEVVGTLAAFSMRNGFVVTPVVAVIPPDLPLVPHEAEVAAVFEVPLAHILDPASRSARVGEFVGVTRHYYEMSWGGRRIWGATAAMLVHLAHQLGHRLP